MTKYYYVTNKDGTTYKGFEPFKNNPDYAEAPDWIDDNRKCGHALHVVSGNPCNALLTVTRNHPVAHEVEPIDLKSKINNKFRCRAVKRIRTLSDDEFVKFFMEFEIPPFVCDDNKANLACENRYLIALDKCIGVGILPTSDGTDWACEYGHLNTLNRCIEVGVLPTSWGANWAAEKGHLDCFNRCIEVGVNPDYGENHD